MDSWKIYLAVLVVACAVFLALFVTPPSLMDDVDSVHAQIARTMLQTGDWVTPRLDGVVDFEKPPLIYWAIAVSYKIFGVHDWAARIPTALSAISLCLSDRGFWRVGVRKASGNVRRRLSCYLRGPVSFYSRFDAGCNACARRCRRDVCVPARLLTTRKTRTHVSGRVLWARVLVRDCW